MELKNISSENMSELNYGKWIVVFWVPWGKPSFKEMRLVRSSRSKSMLACVNVEDNPDIAEKFKVSFFPTTIHLNQGRESKRIFGFSGRRDS
jgi:thioredoxin-like negative regulator of GroEL